MFCYTFPFPSTDEYKTKKLVLRKIEKGDYWIGDKENENCFQGKNSYHKVNIPKAYYISVFDMTGAQYGKIVDNQTSTDKKPKVLLSWNVMRGAAGSGARPSSGVFANLNNNAVLAADGKKCVDLNDPAVAADATIGFDLPTESMWEIAARAGDEHKYPIGQDSYANIGKYIWYYDNSDAGKTLHNVGTKPANAWGLFDMPGNVCNYCRDTWNSGDLATLQQNGLQPVASGTAASCGTRSISYYRGNAGDERIAMFNYSGRQAESKSGQYNGFGIRVAFIP